LSTATRHGETEPKPSAVAEEGHLGGAALVLGYIEARAQGHGVPADEASLVEALLRRVKELETTVAELSARLAELAGAEQQAAELRRSVDTLKARNEALQETIRTLEIGFRRHVSERVSPDQLRLALAAEPDAPGSPSMQVPPEVDGGNVPVPLDPAATADASPSPSLSTEQVGTAETPSGADPKGKKRRNRNNHGRRRIGIIPKVVLETLPPEVLLKGLESFERIGAEDSSVIGYRRGGPIELVLRRPKYVLRTASPAADGVSHEQPSPAAAPASAGEPDDAFVVHEHEALVLPADTGFKRSPFVDGAIVRFVPKPADCGGEDGPVWIAPVPERPIDRSLADPSLLAHVLVHKLDYHTPYYRQEVGSARYGFRLSRANMARWQFECGGLVMHIADAMWTEALTRSWFAMDATGTAIRAKEQYRYGHVFVLVAPGDGVMFRYTPQYDGLTVEQLFGGYQGTLVADASANHNVLFGPGKAREAGCWSHGRKRFVKAFRAGEGKEAAFAVQTIQALFRVEEEAALCSPDERLAIRQCRSAPLIDALFAWAEQQLAVVPEHALLRAGLVYLLNQREALCEFLSNGEIPIHNNASERALRRVVKGRQNWLFHGSDEHARRACAISSLIASCEMHGLDPELYLQEILTVAPSYSLSRALDLSPKNWVATRQRLIAEGRLKYLDLARITGSRLAFRDR
jgi:Transposase IS66 family